MLCINAPLKLAVATDSTQMSPLPTASAHCTIVIRKDEEIDESSMDPLTNKARFKGYFNYHGDGTPPNYDAQQLSHDKDLADVKDTIEVESIQLKLNGQERHPSMTKGLDVKFINHRLLPSLHSNSNQQVKQMMATSQPTSTFVLGHAMTATASSPITD